MHSELGPGVELISLITKMLFMIYIRKKKASSFFPIIYFFIRIIKKTNQQEVYL